MSKQLVTKLISVLDTILKKMSRYDEGSFFAPILSLTVKIGWLFLIFNKSLFFIRNP